MHEMKYSTRVGCLMALMALMVGGALGGCGSDGAKGADTLPPIVTTTTTTTMPPTTTTIPSSYVIKRGDSLFKIAQMFGISTAELAAYNNITKPDSIQAGQKLKIPQPGETTTSTAPVATTAPTPKP